MITVPSWVARSVYRGHERAMQRTTFGYLDELLASQWRSRAEVEALQEAKLNRLLQCALLHSPWHARRIREAGLEEQVRASAVTLTSFGRLPTMDKQDARQNVEALVWRGAPGGVFPYNTGGSSGEPLQFHFGRERQASDAAGRLRARGWWGVGTGEPEVYLWGAPVELAKTDRIKTVRDRLLNQLVLNAFEMSPANMDAYLDAVQAFRPRCIYGYASSVTLLAARARSRAVRLHLPGLKVVCTTGEPLYPHQRTLVEEVFGAPAANEFGSRDIGFTAHETPHRQVLLMSESIVLEVLGPDGRPVPPGVAGEAVMTGLCSSAQPFIRYRTGDMVRTGTQTCRDGRGLHVLDEVMGRTTDFVTRPDGAIMHALSVIYVLRAVEGIAEFKFIQHALRDVEVLVVTGPRWTEASREKLIAGLAARLGYTVRITVRIVDAIAAEASGKYRYVVSHVRPSADVKAATEPQPC